MNNGQIRTFEKKYFGLHFFQNRALKINLYAVGIRNLFLRNHILIITDVINRDDSYL